LFWAAYTVFGRFSVGDVPPVTLAFIRWGGAFLIVLPFRLPHLARLEFVWPNIAGVRRLFDPASLRIPFAVNLDFILRSTATLIRGSQSARIIMGRAMSRVLCMHRQIAENTELRRHLHILKNAAF